MKRKILRKKIVSIKGAVIAQVIHLLLLSCGNWFESQAHLGTLLFGQILYHIYTRRDAEFGPYLKTAFQLYFLEIIFTTLNCVASTLL